MSIAQLSNRMHLLASGATGIAALSDNFTYNGTDISPSWIYTAADASASSWPEKNGGATLSTAGTGSAITTSTFALGPTVVFNGDGGSSGVYFDGGDVNDLGGGSSQEVIFELVVKDGSAGGCAFAKAPATSSGPTYHFRQNGATDWRGRIEGNSGGRNLNTVTSGSGGTWRYILIAFDRPNTTGLVYTSNADAVETSRSDFFSDTDYTNAQNFTVGGFSTGGLQSDLEIAWLACYEPSGVIDLTSTTNIIAAGRARVAAMGGALGAALV